ncbi:MAG: T9SS type A sorting domain-containing protein [Bacteroidetes bacterium]|nr:T9SS type A sorting domain-containing protein [Bacteroidota bacterium]
MKTFVRFFMTAILLFAILPALGGSDVLAQVPVTVTVYQSDGSAPVAGAAISYYNGYWRGLGNTNASGVCSASVPSGNWPFMASYGGTSATQSMDVALTQSLTFYTSEAIVEVYEADGSTPLSGVAVSYFKGYDRGIGNTVGGTVSKQLFGGDVPFKCSFGGTTSDPQTMDLPGDGTTSGESATLTYYTSTATVQVYESDGSTPLSGVAVSYLSGYDRGIGNTVGGTVSKELFGGDVPFKCSFGGTTSAAWTMALPGDGAVSGESASLTFYTSKAMVYVKDCDGTPIAGASVSYKSGYDRGIGNTDASGLCTKQLFPGTWTFKASIGGTTSPTQDMVLPGDGKTTSQSASLTFNPTAVQFAYAGSKAYYSGYWRGFSGKIYLFPGAYDFKFGTTEVEDVPIAGCALNDQVIIVYLKDSNGNPLPGGSVSYWDYGNWRTTGLLNNPTDANGRVVGLVPPGVSKVRMSYLNTSGEQDLVNNIATFTTVKVEAELLAQDNSPLSGGVAHYWGYGNWRLIGTTDGSGKTSIEILPGFYKLRMGYLYTYEETDAPIDYSASATYTYHTTKAVIKLATCSDVPLAGGSAVYYGYGNWRGMVEESTGVFTQEMLSGDQAVYTFRMSYKYVSNDYDHDITSGSYTFNTTNVTLNYPGTIHYYAYGNYRAFTKPSMELLPGDYDFRFSGAGNPNYQKWISVAGCSMTNTLFVLRFLNSLSAPIAGEEGFIREGTTYVSLGNTNANGEILGLLNGNPGSYYFKMKYLGHTQTKLQNIATNPVVLFQTVLVTVELVDSGNNPMKAEELYYRDGNSGYPSLATDASSATIEMLPLSYYFYATLYGHTQTILQNVGTTPIVQFKTVLVTVEMRQGGTLFVADEFLYRNGTNTYVSMGTNVSSTTLEMLPLSYYFKANYGAASKTKLWNVASNSLVPFTWDGVVIGKDAADGAAISPVAIELHGNYPNPFNPTTAIKYSVPEDTDVLLQVFDMQGRLVSTLVDGIAAAGEYTVTFDARDLPSGTYMYRLQAEGQVFTKSMTLLK